MQQQRCIVIGAGIAGLSAAALLAKKGYAVTVLEQAKTYGGKVGQLRIGGAFFDTGPSLCTDPEAIDAVYERCNVNPRDYWQYTELQEITRYFWPSDHSGYIMPVGVTHIERSFVQLFNESPRKVHLYMYRTERVYDAVAQYYIDKEVTPKNLAHPKALLGMGWLVPLLLRTLHNRNSWYFTNEKTRQILDRFATYSGSNPYYAPAVTGFAGVPEMVQGVYFPTGGMRGIADGLYKLCKDFGVKFKFSTKVTSINKRLDRVVYVKTSRQKLDCDIVVYGGDVVRLYELLGDTAAKQKVSQPERSTSGIVFYWEVRGKFKKLGLHNIIFSDDYQEEFAQLHRGEIPSDPTVYINISCKQDKSHATKGTENWFVMVNVPAGTKDVSVLSVKDVVIKKIEAMLGGYITILNEDYLSPSRLDAQTGAWQGAIYGQATNSVASLLSRPKNHEAVPTNLYRVGGTVHPGGGIPLAVRSAIIATDKL